MGIVQSVQNAGEGVAEKMSERMKQTQLEAMERQRTAMQVQMMAVTRERVWWFGGVTATLALALLAGGWVFSVFRRLSDALAASRGKNVAIGLAPLTLLSTVTAYQWDLG